MPHLKQELLIILEHMNYPRLFTGLSGDRVVILRFLRDTDVRFISHLFSMGFMFFYICIYLRVQLSNAISILDDVPCR